MSEIFFIQTLSIGPKDLVKNKRMTAEDIHQLLLNTLSTITYYDETYTVLSIVCKSFFKAFGLQLELEEMNEIYKHSSLANCRDKKDFALLQFTIYK